ncbi:MAG: cation:proton antiporter [Hyphomonas sp.]|nr:cation:proton antiporter [Hyphomonas sp.]
MLLTCRAEGVFVHPAEFFFQIALILIAARVCAEVAVRLGAPSVIGELAAGLILGPSLLGILEPNEIIRLLAEIGIILLLFEAGSESDLGRLLHAGTRSAAVAVSGFIFPFVMAFALSYYVFHQALLVALFVGGTLTATSIGITVRILQDVGRQNSKEGEIVLGAAVLDDVLGVLLLAMLYDFSKSGHVSLTNVARVSALISVFFVIAPIAAKLLAFMISRYKNRAQTPGLVATTIISLVLIFAWIAHAVGAPELLGGFAAGLALSRRFFLPFGAALAQDHEFSEEVQRDMKPIVQLFTPIFFVVVGLSLDLRAIDWSSPYIWAFSLSLAALAIIGKIAGGYILMTEHWLMRTAVGMSMVPRGEVGLIFAELGRTTGILDPTSYAALVLVIAYTTLFSPFWIKMFYRLYGHRPELALEDELDAGPDPPPREPAETAARSD